MPDRLKSYKEKLAESDKLLTAKDVIKVNESSVSRDSLPEPSIKCSWLHVIGDEELPPADWEQGSRPQPIATAVIVVNEGCTEAINLEELYVGKMCLAPRIAGFYRPDVLGEVSGNPYPHLETDLKLARPRRLKWQ